ncbi:hypothetical protein GCM10027614_28090 [Micromonospora vulcania]
MGVGGNLLGKPVTWPAVAAATLGIVFTAALWWAHFDFIGPAARIALHSAEGGPGWRWPATRTRTSICR